MASRHSERPSQWREIEVNLFQKVKLFQSQLVGQFETLQVAS
jgi:hypothetical protein